MVVSCFWTKQIIITVNFKCNNYKASSIEWLTGCLQSSVCSCLTAKKEVCKLSISRHKRELTEGRGLTVVDSPRCSESDRVDHFVANKMSVRFSEAKWTEIGENWRKILDRKKKHFRENITSLGTQGKRIRQITAMSVECFGITTGVFCRKH